MLKTKLPNKLKGKKEKRQQAKIHEQIKNPEKLKLLVLSGSKLISSDFTFMLRCKNLIKLDLSDNQLPSLPQFFILSQFHNLRLVYLHRNNFKSLEDIRPVLQCPYLVHITLHENPIYSSQLQHFLINVMKMLKMVNQRVVYEEERIDSVILTREYIKINIDKLGMSSFDQQSKEGENKYIQGLEKQLQHIDRLWENFNPIVKFQRHWRNLRLRRKVRKNILPQKQQQQEKKEDKQQSLTLKKYFQSWRTYQLGRKQTTNALIVQSKDHLLFDQNRYLQYKRNKRVSEVVKNFLERIRYKVKNRKAVKTFQKFLSVKVLMFQSDNCFYSISQIDKTHRILIGVHQQVLLSNILQHVDKITGKLKPYSIKPCKDYLSIRMLQSFRHEDNHNMYRMFVQPSMRCIFEIKKSKLFKNSCLVSLKQLNHILKSNTKLTQKQIQRMKTVSLQIARYSENQYQNSLLQFYCEDSYYFKTLLRLIYYHNTKSVTLQMKKQQSPSGFNFLNPFSNQLVFYFDKQLKRTTAAVAIQKTWRRHWNSKISSAVIQKIKQNRASMLIQHFYRRLQFSHRQAFNIKINNHLRQFQEPEVWIHQDIYFNICRFKLQKQICPQVTLQHNQDTVKISWRYQKSFFNPVVVQQIGKSEEGKEWSRADNFHLLHTGASVSRLRVNKRVYLKFQYKSLEEAKKRVAYLALLTYLFTQKGVCIKGLSKHMVLNPDQEYEKTVESVFSIKLSQQEGKDEIKEIKNEEALFLFQKSEINHFQQEKQPSASYFVFPLKIYSYLDYQQQPIKLQNNFVLSMRYFKEKNTGNFSNNDVKQTKTSNNPSSMRRLNQKTKRLNQTLKAIASQSPLQLTKIVQPYHKRKQKQYEQKKKQEIRQAKETSFNNKMMATQYKKLQINKVKKWKGKNINLLQKSMSRRQQENENLRQNVKSVALSYRSRRNSQQQKSEHEMQFLQRGNFLFKQYLKMNIMKNRMDDLQSKRSSIPKKTHRAMSESRRLADVMDASISFRHDQKEYDAVQSPTFKSNRESPRYNQCPTERVELEQMSRTEQVIQKCKMKKTRQHMVHGVFPQEFYAIQKKKGAINLPLL